MIWDDTKNEQLYEAALSDMYMCHRAPGKNTDMDSKPVSLPDGKSEDTEDSGVE